MLTKVHSCQRCLNHHQDYRQPQQTAVKRLPQKHLAKTFQQLYLENQKLSLKHNKHKQETLLLRSLKESQPCTFKPKINQDYALPFKDSFLERGIGWTKSKEKKVHQLKTIQDQTDLQQCSFRPQIAPLEIKGRRKGYGNAAGKQQHRGSYRKQYTEKQEIKQVYKQKTKYAFNLQIEKRKTEVRYGGKNGGKDVVNDRTKVVKDVGKKQVSAMNIVDETIDSEKVNNLNPECEPVQNWEVKEVLDKQAGFRSENQEEGGSDAENGKDEAEEGNNVVSVKDEAEVENSVENTKDEIEEENTVENVKDEDENHNQDEHQNQDEKQNQDEHKNQDDDDDECI